MTTDPIETIHTILTQENKLTGKYVNTYDAERYAHKYTCTGYELHFMSNLHVYMQMDKLML